MRPMFFDKAGKPIDIQAFAVLSSDLAYKRVAFDEVAPGVEVSTVWLGYDHAFGIEGDLPIIFETMVFRNGDGYECWRYSTEADAIRGHELRTAELRTRAAGRPAGLPDVPR